MARLILPYQSVYDLNGHPLPGAKMYFYESGTVTPKDTYSDEALTTPNTNPVIADSQGQFGDIFLSGAYSCKLTDADDVTQPDYPAEIAAGLDTASAVLLTGDQTWAGEKTATDKIAVKMDTPIYELEENDAAANNRLYQIIAESGKYILRLSNDARDSFTNFMEVSRTDNTVDTIDLETTDTIGLTATNTIDLTATSVKANGIDIVPLDEDDMVSDSDTSTATQQSIKAYVDLQDHSNYGAQIPQAGLSDVFGVWTSKSVTTIYQATTDGFLSVYGDITDAAGSASVTVYSDSNASPSTVIHTEADQGSPTGRMAVSICIPIKKDEYYKTLVVATASSLTLKFIPLGS